MFELICAVLLRKTIEFRIHFVSTEKTVGVDACESSLLTISNRGNGKVFKVTQSERWCGERRVVRLGQTGARWLVFEFRYHQPTIAFNQIDVTFHNRVVVC
jgi:hypothetical protein